MIMTRDELKEKKIKAGDLIYLNYEICDLYEGWYLVINEKEGSLVGLNTKLDRVCGKSKILLEEHEDISKVIFLDDVGEKCSLYTFAQFLHTFDEELIKDLVVHIKEEEYLYVKVVRFNDITKYILKVPEEYSEINVGDIVFVKDGLGIEEPVKVIDIIKTNKRLKEFPRSINGVGKVVKITKNN